MHWRPITGLLLLFCLLTYSEVHGQASSSVGFTIVVHEQVSAEEDIGVDLAFSPSAPDAGSGSHPRSEDVGNASPDVQMYLEVAGETKPFPDNDPRRDDIVLTGLQQYLFSEKDSSLIYPEDFDDTVITSESITGEAEACLVVMEYN
ncbi:MAG: hypothetical protein ACLFS0_05170 [Bacteroidales bacterium]